MLQTDVLIVGGGPAGSAVAIRLARAGHSVTLIEKRAVPRHKACGDALTPRSIAELAALDVEPMALGAHAIRGVRLVHRGAAVTLPWPDHPDFPARGAVLRREHLDRHLRARAEAAGAAVLMGHEATTPIIERGFVRGAHVSVHTGGTEEIRARFVVVADGANSRFGRALGTTRERNWPYGIATRTYFHSPRHDETWIESTLGPPDSSGTPIAGQGWVIPVGDGTVNVGVGMLSTYRDVRAVNTLKLLDTFAASLRDQWDVDPSAQLKAPTRFRVPLGGSVGPKMGPTFLLVGDAAGAANPFNGDGIDGALRTGRLAAQVLDEALAIGSSATLQLYPTLLAAERGRYDKVGRLTDRFLGRPAILRPLLRLGIRSDAVMGAALRIATDELRSTDPGAAERAYALASAASRLAPNW